MKGGQEEIYGITTFGIYPQVSFTVVHLDGITTATCCQVISGDFRNGIEEFSLSCEGRQTGRDFDQEMISLARDTYMAMVESEEISRECRNAKEEKQEQPSI